MTAVRQVRMRFHNGNILKIVSDRYPTLLKALLEEVQNGIDADAKRIFLGIDFGSRLVVSADDGRGVTSEEFDEALDNLADSRKDKDPADEREMLGQFGIGVVAPFNKCERFTFTSCSVRTNFPVEWSFERKRLLARRAGMDMTIPARNLSTMPRLPEQFWPFTQDFGEGKWRTIVQMNELTNDRIIKAVNPDDLEEQIRTRFGHAMHKKGVVCRVAILNDGRAEVRDIEPRMYTGDPLPPFSYLDKNAGPVTFDLYRAKRRNSQRRGVVSVSQASPIYPLPWSSIRVQAMGLGYANLSEAFSVLQTGYFEGLIMAENLELAVDRDLFVGNEALVGLYVAIEEWYHKVGRAAYEVDKEQDRDERYRQLSLDVMESVRNHLRSPEFASLAEGVRARIGIGRIGQGHGQDKDVVGQDERPTTRTGQGGVGVQRTLRPVPTPQRSRQEATPTRDGDMPTGVVGKGKRRTLVKEDSLGLWIEVTDFEFSTAVWDFDRRTGVLSFNSGSALWSEIDGASVKKRTKRNDQNLEHLQKWVVLQVLTLLLLPEEDYERGKQQVDIQLKPYITMFVTGRS